MTAFVGLFRVNTRFVTLLERVGVAPARFEQKLKGVLDARPRVSGEAAERYIGRALKVVLDRAAAMALWIDANHGLVVFEQDRGRMAEILSRFAIYADLPRFVLG